MTLSAGRHTDPLTIVYEIFTYLSTVDVESLFVIDWVVLNTGCHHGIGFALYLFVTCWRTFFYTGGNP